MQEAGQHLNSAETLVTTDPAGAYDMLYLAARKSMAAVLAAQGLRATSRGGHIAVQEAMFSQLGQAATVVKAFARLLRTRNDADYPHFDTPVLDVADVQEAMDNAAAADILGAMKKFLPLVTPWA